MLQRAFGISTPYMPKIAGAPLVDNYKVSAQWSRRMNSLKLWLTLRVHGRLAYEHLIARQLEMAKQLAAWFAQSEHFELAAPPRLPILNVRVKIDGDEAQVAAANAAMVDEVTRDGEQWISLTHARGRSVIRMMIISYLTTEANVRQLQQTLTAAAEKVLAREHAARA
jgi:L-2,4-diaminobutyrate decarboxylase